MVQQEDRMPDGNILPEARERIIEALSDKILADGDLSPYRLARRMGVQPSTAKLLIQEAVLRWRTTHENEIAFQKEWIRKKITAVMNAEATDAFDDGLKMRTILALFKELNALFALAPEDNEPQPETRKFVVWGKLSRKSCEAARERGFVPMDESGRKLTDDEVEKLQRQGHISVPYQEGLLA